MQLSHAYHLFVARSTSMDTQASKMIVKLNEILGSDLCTDNEQGEMTVPVTTVTALFDDDKVG